VLTHLLKFLREYGVRISVFLGTFAVVASFIVVQQAREVLAEQYFHSAHAQVIAEQAHAQALGLEDGELFDLQRQELTTAGQAPPVASAPFNENRIAFFTKVATEEIQIKDQLTGREQQLLTQTRDSAQQAITKLGDDFRLAQQIGVDDHLLGEFSGLTAAEQSALDAASTVGAYRGISADLKEPLSTLSLEIADQQTTNSLISQFAAQAAAKDHGDPAAALAGANASLSQVQTDLQTARVFQMDVTTIDGHVQTLAAQLGRATTAPDLEQINGGLMLQDSVLQKAMSTSLPDKALTISLKEQVIRAFDHGQQVFWSYVTTGRPGLETDPGSFKVYWKVTPWTMHSPWPRGSAYWYPDSKVNMVMWFNGGDGIHDAWWRAYYGPGTEFPHYDPYGEDNGTHGCVNVPYGNMVWLWNWTPVGTPVIVY
jgi:lipoprotein-anchoring transpeptidase ErfK/SrfK